jgi:hypothetical protein
MYNQGSKGWVMSYNITFVQKKDYLQAQIVADSTPEDVFNSLTEITKTCLKYKYRKVLIEENFIGPTISTFDIFSIIDQISPSVSPDIQQVAFVDVDERHREAIHFAETVAVNRGVNIKLFTDLKLAEEWINRQGSSD